MNFEDIINDLEQNKNKYDYLIKYGQTPIMLTSVHTVEQKFKNKFAESYTCAISQFVGNNINSYYMIKSIDNGIDSNSVPVDEFKQLLLKIIKENNIKLLIDIHGARKERDFDIEFGTLKDMTCDITIQNNFMDILNKHDIHNISFNDPFCGGGITRYIYENTDIDIIQIEINYRYRDPNNLEYLQKLCNALTEFLKTYANFN